MTLLQVLKVPFWSYIHLFLSVPVSAFLFSPLFLHPWLHFFPVCQFLRLPCFVVKKETFPCFFSNQNDRVQWRVLSFSLTPETLILFYPPRCISTCLQLQHLSKVHSGPRFQIRITAVVSGERRTLLPIQLSDLSELLERSTFVLSGSLMCSCPPLKWNTPLKMTWAWCALWWSPSYQSLMWKDFFFVFFPLKLSSFCVEGVNTSRACWYNN